MCCLISKYMNIFYFSTFLLSSTVATSHMCVFIFLLMKRIKIKNSAAKSLVKFLVLNSYTWKVTTVLSNTDTEYIHHYRKIYYNILLLSISNLTHCSQRILCMILTFWNLLSCVLWPRKESILVNFSCALEKIIQSFPIIGSNCQLSYIFHVLGTYSFCLVVLSTA